MIEPGLLADLAERASDLFERLAPPFVTEPAEEHAPAIERRLARWAALGAKGDLVRLRRSVARRGIDLDAVGPALGRARLASGSELPDWVVRFETLAAAALDETAAYRHGRRPARPRFVRAEPVAFETVLAPFVLATSRRLGPALPGGVVPPALAGLERRLLVRLSRLCRPVLQQEWAGYEREALLARDARVRAFDFAARMLTSPVPAFLAAYPVLARLVTLVCDNWTEAAEEALRRVRDDCSALARTFNGGAALGDLADVQAGDSDLHDGHRETLILTFASGTKIVYKPRSLELDAAFRRLVDAINARGLSHALASPAVLCRAGYGYAAYIEGRLCESEDELARFYHRMGALAALAVALGSTDLHYTNVIASGERPVPVDLETILSAELQSSARLGETSAATREEYARMRRSVIGTMLLPMWQKGQHDGFVDRSAIGVCLGNAQPPHIPSLPCPPDALESALRRHGGAILAGFEEAYHVLLACRDELTAWPRGPLAAFAGGAIRIVVRDTWLYTAILRESVAPEVLRDGADRSIALERLNHIAAMSNERPVFGPLINRERAAMLGLDVPRFNAVTNDTALFDAGGIVAPDAVQRSPVEEMLDRFAALSADDLRRQSRVLEGCMAARLATLRTDSSGAPWRTADRLPPREELIARATAIADRLLDTDCLVTTAGRSWEGLAFEPHARRWAWTPVGDGLANGRLGLALLFASLERAGGPPRWGAVSREIAAPVLARFAELLAAPPRDHVPWLGLDGGLGGALCAAATLAAMLGSDIVPAELINRAAAFAPAPHSLTNVRDGVAGMLVGLGALSRALDDDRLLAAASRCRNHLAGTRDAPPAEDGWTRGMRGIVVPAMTNPGDNRAVEALLQAPLAELDSYRLGSAGEIDALLWLAQHPARADLAAATERAAAVLARAERCGWRLVPDIGESPMMPGLFDGIAGIGYLLLRLAAPHRVPSLVALTLGQPEWAS